MYRLRFLLLSLLFSLLSHQPARSDSDGAQPEVAANAVSQPAQPSDSALSLVEPGEEAGEAREGVTLAEQDESAELEATVELLQSAIRERIAVSFDRRSGTTIPAGHCRKAAVGCERRLAEFARYLVEAAERHEVDPWLLAAIAVRESGLNPFAQGARGELGILQIHPGRRDASQVRFIRDENYRKRCRRQPGACQREVVEHAAALVQRTLQHCHGDLLDALGLYNTGRCGGNHRYARRILAERDDLRRSVGLAPVDLAGSARPLKNQS